MIKFTIKAKKDQRILCSSCGEPFYWRAKSNKWDHKGCGIKAPAPNSIKVQSIYWEFDNDPKRIQTDTKFKIKPNMWNPKTNEVINDPDGKYEVVQRGIRALKEKIDDLMRQGISQDDIRATIKDNYATIVATKQDPADTLHLILKNAIKNASSMTELAGINNRINKFIRIAHDQFEKKIYTFNQVLPIYMAEGYTPKSTVKNKVKTKQNYYELAQIAVNGLGLFYRYIEQDPEMQDAILLEKLAAEGVTAEVPLSFLDDREMANKWNQYLGSIAIQRNIPHEPISDHTKKYLWEKIRAIYRFAHGERWVDDGRMLHKGLGFTPGDVKTNKFVEMNDLALTYEYDGEELEIEQALSILILESGMRHIDISQLVDESLWENGQPWGTTRSKVTGEPFFWYHRHKSDELAAIPINAHLKKALETVIKRFKLSGKMLNESQLRRALYKFQDEVLGHRLPWTQHMFRRTFSQMYANSGYANKADISLLLGHPFDEKEKNVTWKNYAQANIELINHLPANSLYDLYKKGVNCETTIDESHDILDLHVAQMKAS